MTELHQSIGRQHNSQKQTMPSYSVGSGGRAVEKLHMKHHETRLTNLNSPGPAYRVPSSIADGPKFGFGLKDKPAYLTQYPVESCEDHTSRLPDSQSVKFHSTKGGAFGTGSHPNAEYPGGFGTGSRPHSLNFDYKPEVEGVCLSSAPKFSFAHKAHKRGGKCSPRVDNEILTIDDSNAAAPGSHTLPNAVGKQPSSPRRTAPSFSFGSYRTDKSHGDKEQSGEHFLPELSSLGKQVVSKARSAPSPGFGTASTDRSPVAKLRKPALHLDIPSAGGRVKPRQGM